MPSFILLQCCIFILTLPHKLWKYFASAIKRIFALNIDRRILRHISLCSDNINLYLFIHWVRRNGKTSYRISIFFLHFLPKHPTRPQVIQCNNNAVISLSSFPWKMSLHWSNVTDKYLFLTDVVISKYTDKFVFILIDKYIILDVAVVVFRPPNGNI